MRYPSLTSLTLAAVIAGAIMTGCSESRSEGSTKGLGTMVTSIAATKTQVSTTVTDLEALKTATDVKAAYAKVAHDSESVKSNAAQVKSDYEDMKAKSDVYLETWQKEIASVQDPALKATAAERFSKVKIALIEITNGLGNAKDAYQPFVSSLDDVQKLLANDTTPGGVKAVTPAIDKA
ncbi:MAG TPA: DUF2959 family protein, partial [Planctomycetota bacterium]|nr:DUF2959 family protein [Planctomycetota bacterium]